MQHFLTLIVLSCSVLFANGQQRDSVRGYELKEYSSIFPEAFSGESHPRVYYFKDMVMWRSHVNYNDNNGPSIRYNYFVYDRGSKYGIRYYPSQKSKISNIRVDSLMKQVRVGKSEFHVMFDSLDHKVITTDIPKGREVVYKFFEKGLSKERGTLSLSYTKNADHPDVSLYQQLDSIPSMRLTKIDLEFRIISPEIPDSVRYMIRDQQELRRLTREEEQSVRSYFDKFELDKKYVQSDIDSMRPGPADTSTIAGYELAEIGQSYQADKSARIFYYKDLEMNQRATIVSSSSGGKNQSTTDYLYFIRKVGADSGFVVYQKNNMFNGVMESSSGITHGYDKYQHFKSYKALKLSERKKSGLLYRSYKISEPNSNASFKLVLIYTKDNYPPGLSLSATFDTIPGMKLIRIEKIARNIYSDEKVEWDEVEKEGHELRKLTKQETEATRPYFLGYEKRGEW